MKPAQDASSGPGEWLVAGAEVVHAKFGTGTVAAIGKYKTVDSVWIDFDAGIRKLFEIKYALPFLRPRGRDEAVTPASPQNRCDYCGGRPVVVSVTGRAGTQMACATHRTNLAKDLRP